MVKESGDKEYKVRLRKKEGMASWQTKSMKVEFSDSSIQAWDEYAHVGGPEGIVYFYYTMRLYRKGGGHKKWKEAGEVRAYDAPGILSLQASIRALLQREAPEGGCKCAQVPPGGGPEGTERYRYSLCTDGIVNEDTYEVAKEIWVDRREGTAKERYSFYAGVPASWQGGDGTCGLREDYISREGMELLLECVSGFIDCAIQRHNQDMVKYLEGRLSSYGYAEGKVYGYEDGKLANVFIPSDSGLSVYVLKGDIRGGGYSSECYHDARIQSASMDGITVAGGYKDKAGTPGYEAVTEEEIPYGRIISIFQDSMDRSSLSIGGIADDFYKTLSGNERGEFACHSINCIYGKWKEALVGRYFMCHDNHPFITGLNDNIRQGYDAAAAVLRMVLQMVKADAADDGMPEGHMPDGGGGK